MIQNERFGTGLKQYLPYAKIIDQTKTSDQYFRLFDVPDKLYVGKNSFRIRINRNTLVQGSLLYIDVVDSTGEIIYHEIIVKHLVDLQDNTQIYLGTHLSFF